MSGEILFLAHRIPFPPDRGDKIRSHHILKRLARIAPVHVATFADDAADLAEEVELATLARSYRLVHRRKPLLWAGVQALRDRLPVSLLAFADQDLASYVRHILAARPIRAVYVFSGQMGQYVPHDFKGRVIADFVDVDSAKFEAYARRSRGVIRWVEGREGRLLRQAEAALARRADASLLISSAEAELFRSRLTPEQQRQADVRVLPNGIDSHLFDPAQIQPETRIAAVESPRLIFTGQMDYPPNIAAVRRMAEHILPQVQRACPAATFHIIGRNPTSEVLALNGRARVHVWGRVDDVRPWLMAADIAVAPLDIARGVQNKVLEAMALARPVVLTKAAATGIDGRDGTHFAVAESDQDIARRITELAAAPARAQALGAAARHFVTETMSWQSALDPLGAIISGPVFRRDAA